MQYRVYDRQTLGYKDGGYVRSYTIDDDYIVNNNSTLSVVKKRENTLSDVNVGDVIVLIETSGAYHKGVITTVDDTALTISYKGDKELFNDNMRNAFVTSFIDEEVDIAGRFGIDVVVGVLKAIFVSTDDRFKRLPIKFITEGDVLDESGNPKMLWSWSNDSIAIVDWLVELFTLYNLSLLWTIDFNTAEQTLDRRRPQYVCTLSAITNSGGIIKDNVAMQTITYTTKDLPDATVCEIIGSDSKELIYMSDKNLLDPKGVTENTRIEYLTTNTVALIPDNSSNVSGYIRIRAATESNPHKFTYSQNGGDELTRYVIGYNSNKKVIAYFSYTPSETNKNFTFNTDTFILVGNNTKEQIKWFRLCYCNEATEQQIEVGDNATEYAPFSTPAVYYLYEKDGIYSISPERDLEDKYRVLPVKTIIATWNENDTDAEGTTPEDVAREKLVPSQFNQAIQIRISADSKMFDFENARFGDLYKIINELGTIDSNYTGRRHTSDNKWVTLYFGLGRQNYTDLMQMRLRKSRYTQIYNRSV